MTTVRCGFRRYFIPAIHYTLYGSPVVHSAQDPHVPHGGPAGRGAVLASQPTSIKPLYLSTTTFMSK